MYSRRKALALIGGGTVFAASAAATGFLATRTPDQALRPWSLAGQYEDPRLNALSFALLAPNPHNLQPWQVALEGEDRLHLFHDRSKRLPETDPFDRQIMIGFGCFIEQLQLAAGAAGHQVALTLLPEGPDGPIATAQFAPGAQADPLAKFILDRRSCKEAYEAKSLPKDMAQHLGKYAQIHTDPEKVAALRALTWESWMTECLTPHTHHESVDLMRFGKAEINANPDGIHLGGAFLESLMAIGALSRSSQADTSSSGFQQGAKLYHDMLMATPAYAVLTSETNEVEDQIYAGRQWLRLNLATTQLGLALHPVSQALQEYPEMSEHYAKAHDLLAQKGHKVQMLGRLGFGPSTQPSPRWPLEAKLIAG